MKYNEKIEKIVSYIRRGEKNPKNFRLGLEMEHFCVDKESLDTLDYYSELGVEDSLEILNKDKGFEISLMEDGDILGLKKDEFAISVEPAGQFEVAIDGKSKIPDIKKAYDRVMSEIVEVFDEKNQYLVTLGYHPKSKINDLKIIPKKRYEYMSRYFKEFGGKYALNMMKGTASLQTAIDFENEEDFKLKFFVANALSTFLYSLFDNSYIFEGESYKERNLREKIWQYCDPKRTGVYDFAFDDDFSFEKYAKKILDTDIIFINENGTDKYLGNVKFSEVMDIDSSDEMIFHALSIVFPDVRVKNYIEIRMPDEVPAPYNFAFLALIKGLFYNKKNLLELRDIFSDMNYENYEKLRDESYEKGIFAKYGDNTINQWLLIFIDMAKKGLQDDEREFLRPIEELMEVKKTLRDKFEFFYKEDPKNAVKIFSVNHYLEREKNGKN